MMKLKCFMPQIILILHIEISHRDDAIKHFRSGNKKNQIQIQFQLVLRIYCMS